MTRSFRSTCSKLFPICSVSHLILVLCRCDRQATRVPFCTSAFKSTVSKFEGVVETFNGFAQLVFLISEADSQSPLLSSARRGTHCTFNATFSHSKTSASRSRLFKSNLKANRIIFAFPKLRRCTALAQTMFIFAPKTLHAFFNCMFRASATINNPRIAFPLLYPLAL